MEDDIRAHEREGERLVGLAWVGGWKPPEESAIEPDVV